MKNVFLVLVLCSSALDAEGLLSVQTTEYPPYQYLEGGSARGLSTLLVEAIAARAGFESRISFSPWPRAENYLNEYPVLFFNLSRTRERESRYQWIADITPHRPALWKLKRRTMVIDVIADVVPLTLAVLTGSVDEKYFLDRGVSAAHLSKTSSNLQSVQLLAAGKVDLIPMDDTVFLHLARQLGLDLEKFERAFGLNEMNADSWLVANASVPVATVNRLRAAWSDMKNDGTAARIRKEFLARYRAR